LPQYVTMTFISGWKINRAIGIISDSAITTDIEYKVAGEEKLVTPFGDVPIVSEQQVVHQYGLKIYSPTEKMVVAYSGSLSVFKMFYDDLRGRLASTQDNEYRVLLQLLKEYSPTPAELALIVGVIIGKEDVLLLGYNCKGMPQNELKLGEFFIAGNSDDDYDNLFLGLLRQSIGRKLSPMQQLVLCCATAQALSMKHATFQKGYGGNFYGVVLHDGIIMWQSSTIYIIVSLESLQEINIVRSLVEGDYVAFISQKNNGALKITGFEGFNPPSSRKFLFTLNQEAEYYVIIDILGRGMSLLTKERNQKDRLLEINWTTKGVKLEIKEQLLPIPETKDFAVFMYD
jgi:hypothetical protein